MGTLWLESVVISNILNGVGNTVGANMGVTATNSNGFIFLTLVHNLAIDLLFDPVAELQTAKIIKFIKNLEYFH